MDGVQVPSGCRKQVVRENEIYSSPSIVLKTEEQKKYSVSRGRSLFTPKGTLEIQPKACHVNLQIEVAALPWLLCSREGPKQP